MSSLLSSIFFVFKIVRLCLKCKRERKRVNAVYVNELFEQSGGSECEVNESNV